MSGLLSAPSQTMLQSCWSLMRTLLGRKYIKPVLLLLNSLLGEKINHPAFPAHTQTRTAFMLAKITLHLARHLLTDGKNCRQLGYLSTSTTGFVLCLRQICLSEPQPQLVLNKCHDTVMVFCKRKTRKDDGQGHKQELGLNKINEFNFSP